MKAKVFIDNHVTLFLLINLYLNDQFQKKKQYTYKQNIFGKFVFKTIEDFGKHLRQTLVKKSGKLLKKH